MARAILNPLTREEEDTVHEESIKILEQVGIKVMSEPVLRMLEEHGAKADRGTKIAKLSERMVKDALAKAPKEFKMCARDKSKDLDLPAKDHVQGCNDGQPTTVWDMATQRKRKATVQDLLDLTTVCDAMPEVDLYWPEVVANDLPPEVSSSHEYIVSLIATSKHIQHGAGSVIDARFLIDAAAIGVEFGGGPAFVMAREHLLRFLDDTAPAK